MPFHTTTLPNGLQIVGETVPSARSVAVGYYVRTGSRDETPAESGVSHFLEHMMFKGTPRRTALDVNRDFDKIGASYNAFTSEEVTAYYAAVLPEYLPATCDIITDILRPSLRQDDFDTEKQVILEEIGMYADMPSAAAFDHARIHYYKGHPLGNSVLGTTESVTALTRDQMQNYFDRRYSPSNITAVAAGKFDWDEFVELCRKGCGHWTNIPTERSHITAVPNAGGTFAVEKAGVAQEQVIVLSPGPDAASDLRYAAAVLSVALGDDSGSRFYWSLVDPGLADSASSSTDGSEGSGLIYTFMTCEPDASTDNLAIIRKVLSEVQTNGITDEELSAAKSKIASRVVRGSERPQGLMRALAGAWIYRKERADADVELARYDAVTQKDIRTLLDRFPLTDNTVVAYGPRSTI
ncbi:MAG: pitrilysin family protein [Gemmataceae bacterium]